MNNNYLRTYSCGKCYKTYQQYKRKKNLDGLYLCQDCQRKYRLEYKSKFNSNRRFKDPTSKYSHKSSLKLAYGLTIEQYDVMLKTQNNLCFICKKPEISGRRLSVDHNHITNKVRKLLCGTCNKGLGQFKDNPLILMDAAKYLLSHV